MLINLIRRYGVWGLVKIAFSRALSNYINFNISLFYHYIPHRSVIEACLIKESLLVFNVNNQSSIIGRYITNRDARVLTERLQKGHECCVFLDGNHDKAKGFAWIAYKFVYLDELKSTYSLGSDCALIYDCFVYPEHRGKGIYALMLRTIVNFISAERQHIRRILICSLFENRASRRGIKRARFKLLGKALFIKFLCWSKYRLKLKRN